MPESDSGQFHVAVIMDGNGRWAKARGLARIVGHDRGARRVNELVRGCPDLGVTHLTLFTFSTENWRRPPGEVAGLMHLFGQHIRTRTAALHRDNVRVRFIGLRHRIPAELRGLMETLEERTRACHGLNLTIAIDYGGRDELTRAVRAIAWQVAAGSLPLSAISEDLVGSQLDTRELPDPDLIIRTSGEFRLSNFLLWQSVYAEYHFVETPWPDFTVDHFAQAVASYRSRRRRFGRIEALQHRPG